MLKKLFVSSVIAGVMAFGIPTALVLAQQTTAEQDAKKAKQEAKTAGKEAGKATKDAAKATGKGVKKGAKKTGQVTKDAAKETAQGTKKAGEKVKDAVTLDTTSAVCKDGTTQTGKTKTTACANHGGVAGR
jgi:biopolymer transport protein ExbB/TolQ